MALLHEFVYEFRGNNTYIQDRTALTAGKKIGRWLWEQTDLSSGKETKKKWYFVRNVVMTYCEKNWFNDWEDFWNLRQKAKNLQVFWNH